MNYENLFKAYKFFLKIILSFTIHCKQFHSA